MRVSKMTVYRLVHNGELPAVRVGRSFRVHAKAVHDMLETLLLRRWLALRAAAGLRVSAHPEHPGALCDVRMSR